MSYIIYILFAFICISISIADYFVKSTKIKIVMLVIPLLVFVFLASLRNNSVGLDTQGYASIYTRARSIEPLSSFFKNVFPEYGFYSLVLVFSRFFKFSEIVFRFFYFSFMALCLFFAFWKIDKPVFKLSLFLFLGFFNMSFSGIRQSMSMAIMTLGLSILIFYNFKNIIKYIVYFVLNLIAISFHSSSAIMLLIPLLFLIRINKNNFIFIFPLLLFAPSIIQNLINVASYFTYVHYDNSKANVSITFVLSIVLIIVFYIFVSDNRLSNLIKNKISFINFEFDRLYDSKIILLVFGSCIFTACNIFSLVVPRYAMYFYLGVALFLTKFTNCFTNRYIRFASYVAIVLFFGLFFVYKTPDLGLVPYSFITL